MVHFKNISKAALFLASGWQAAAQSPLMPHGLKPQAQTAPNNDLAVLPNSREKSLNEAIINVNRLFPSQNILTLRSPPTTPGEAHQRAVAALYDIVIQSDAVRFLSQPIIMSPDAAASSPANLRRLVALDIARGRNEEALDDLLKKLPAPEVKAVIDSQLRTHMSANSKSAVPLTTRYDPQTVRGDLVRTNQRIDKVVGLIEGALPRLESQTGFNKFVSALELFNAELNMNASHFAVAMQGTDKESRLHFIPRIPQNSTGIYSLD